MMIIISPTPDTPAEPRTLGQSSKGEALIPPKPPLPDNLAFEIKLGADSATLYLVKDKTVCQYICSMTATLGYTPRECGMALMRALGQDISGLER